VKCVFEFDSPLDRFLLSLLHSFSHHLCPLPSVLMEISVLWSSMPWEEINLAVISWKLLLIAHGTTSSLTPFITPPPPPPPPSLARSIDFVSELLTRGLSLDSEDPFSLTDQFARDNVGNYVLQSILKRLHREMLCIATSLSKNLTFQTNLQSATEQNQRIALQLVPPFCSFSLSLTSPHLLCLEIRLLNLFPLHHFAILLFFFPISVRILIAVGLCCG
jgi:hypothetical protein